jgi:glycolate oxidase FAD binding subunit
MLQPTSIEEAAVAIREHTHAGKSVRARGGATKLRWGGAAPATNETVELDTRSLNQIVEHNSGDFTAVLDAGVSLQAAQAAFRTTGQLLAIDPPLGAANGATIGGVLATNDSGPLRHRYGSMRDLIIGITVVLSDGTVAKSGGKVIKNVAGYDLAKLFTGSFGTLGLIARLAVRLHPLPAATATVIGRSSSIDKLAAAALALCRLPLEADCLDVSWSQGSGSLLVRFAGAAAEQRARTAAARITGLDDVQTISDDAQVWANQRAGQRSAEGMVVKVSGRATDLPTVLRIAEAAGGTIVGRAGLGLSWITIPTGADVSALRQTLAPRACTVLDGAEHVGDPWPSVELGVLALMRRVKDRFDPSATFRRGAFVGGI